MSKVIIFSTKFPSYHPRKGEPTFFVEKIFKSLGISKDKISEEFGHEFNPKHHTIRAGNRWKVGDKFSPRIWSGKPYRSKTITIAPDIEVKKVWDFEMDFNGIYAVNGIYIDPRKYKSLAKNDGLTEDDMFNWFMPNYNKPKDFSGQIICWNKSIEY